MSTPSSEHLSAALQTALKDGAIPFSLSVNCTDEQGIRSFDLIGNSVGIWKGEVQVRVTGQVRGRLLQALMDSGFVGFETHYGGKPGSGRLSAPIIVMCAVEVIVDGQEKSSYQDINGERSAALLGLAGELLDHIEPLVTKGVGADSLADGLGKVQSGQLAPETFSLRVMHLPADKSTAGEILQIERGQLGRQVYHPGVFVGEWQMTPLTDAQLGNVVQLLVQNQVDQLPQSLPSESSWQLTTRVLNQEHAVRARKLDNPLVNQRVSEATSFEHLAKSLLAMGQELETR